MTRNRSAVVGLGLVVGLVLADSSVVILALPDILARFHVPIRSVAWVLTIFNLVMALAAVPAAHLSRRISPALVCRAGLVGFALASLGCALAPGFDWLLAFRAAQAVGGAAAACAALELLPAATGSERRAVVVWAASGAVGAAAGPAIGGALTQLASWSAIFFVQVPLALAALALVPRAAAPGPRAAGRAAGRPRQRRARAGVGGAHRCAVSDRAAADQRLGLLAARGRGDRLGDAGLGAGRLSRDPGADAALPGDRRGAC